MNLVDHIRKASIKGWLGKGAKEKEIRRRLKIGEALILKRVTDLMRHDPYTKDHCVKVAQYASMFAIDWGLPQTVRDQWYVSALLHDIGKLLVPSEIINSTTKLTDEQWQTMKLHTLFGELLLRGPGFIEQHPELKPFWQAYNDKGPGVFETRPELEDVLMLDGLDHHERPNGTGYPKKKKGEMVSTLARVIAVVDTYDALTSDRSYRRPETNVSAIQKLEEGAARGDYDPIIVTKFKDIITGKKNELVQEIKRLHPEFNDTSLIPTSLRSYIGRATLSIETVVNEKVREAAKLIKDKNKYYLSDNPLSGLNANQRKGILDATISRMNSLYPLIDEDSLRIIVYSAAKYPLEDDITPRDVTLSMSELRERVEQSITKAQGRHHVEIVLDVTRLKLDELKDRSVIVYQGRLCDKIIISNKPPRIALMYINN